MVLLLSIISEEIILCPAADLNVSERSKEAGLALPDFISFILIQLLYKWPTANYRSKG